jgi:hypothetical protein
MKDAPNLSVAMQKLGIEVKTGWIERTYMRTPGFPADTVLSSLDGVEGKTFRWRKCWLFKAGEEWCYIPGSNGTWTPDEILWWIQFLGEYGAKPLVKFNHTTIAFEGEEWYGKTIGKALGRMGKTWPERTETSEPQ